MIYEHKGAEQEADASKRNLESLEKPVRIQHTGFFFIVKTDLSK
jgi:hypothetical protein